jgi:hypothetical protein
MEKPLDGVGCEGRSKSFIIRNYNHYSQRERRKENYMRGLCWWVLFMAGGFARWPTQDRGERRDRCRIFDPLRKAISDS